MYLAYRLKQLVLALGDTIAFSIGFWLSLFLRYQQLPDAEVIGRHIGLFSAVFCFWIVVNYINGLYDLGRHTTSGRLYRRLIEAAAISFVLSIAFFYLLPRQTIAPKTILLMNIILGYFVSGLWRLVYERFVDGRTLHTRVMFVGYTPEVAALIAQLATTAEKVYHISAIIEPNIERMPTEKNIPEYSTLKDIPKALLEHPADVVIIAPHIRAQADAEQDLYQLLFTGVEITDLASFYEVITGRIPPFIFSERWFLEHLRVSDQPIYERIRTIMDYAAALLFGLVLLVLLPFIAGAIKLTSRGPIFFHQKRVGKSGVPFTLYKFRSMYVLAPDGSAEVNGAQFAKKNDTRITPVGKFLRKTRIDELPQVWNILKRDLTLVGPRPERPEITSELEKRISYYPLRHVVRPGITGWAQIHQNYTDTFETTEEKLQYDFYYIKNKSLLLDISILLRTVNVILRFRGQ